MSIAITLTNPGQGTLLSGSVTRFTGTHGSSWGQITPDGADRKVFFNRTSLFHASDFDLLQLGQKVRFEEESDPVNGTRAFAISPLHAEPYTDFARPTGR